MAVSTTPHFANDLGVEKIEVGVKEFKCMGARPPYDHPHVYLDMGQDKQLVCPYCSTLYVYSEQLDETASAPPGCLVQEQPAAA